MSLVPVLAVVNPTFYPGGHSKKTLQRAASTWIEKMFVQSIRAADNWQSLFFSLLFGIQAIQARCYAPLANTTRLVRATLGPWSQRSLFEAVCGCTP